MKVKICQKVFDSDKQPIMLILSGAEKKLIASMAPDAHRFCIYPEGNDPQKIKQFMDDTNGKGT